MITYTDEELQYIKNNYLEMATSDIALHLGRTSSAVKLQARRMGLKKHPYICDYHYFENIDTEEKAYWLGFLSADGWININKQSNAGVVGIELQYRDINHLKKFNKSIKGNYKITDRWKVTTHKEKKNHMCCIRIFSLVMYKSLVALGFSNNEISIPNIPDDLLRHYMRGYFDGDGCFTFTNKSFNINFSTASLSLKNDIEEILIQHNWNPKPYQIEGTHIYVIPLYSIQDKLEFLDWIYDNSSIYLDRKYKKYLKVKEQHRT